MRKWLKVPVVNLNPIILTVARKKMCHLNLAVTIRKRKKTAKTIARLAKPAVQDSFFLLF